MFFSVIMKKDVNAEQKVKDIINIKRVNRHLKMRVQQINYLENLTYYLIKNLKNLKRILNNYYLRNANKLRSK